jgi:EmrB/QacA subfamily drug resistance transporter
MHAPSSPAALDHRDIKKILFGIVTAMFLAALEQTIVATALPSIGRDLGDVEHMSWVVTAYLVASTTVTPLYGKLSDIHGRRIVLMTGIAVFIIGSVACALAPTMLTLIAARALQGLGGGGLLALAQTIIGDIIPPRERGRYQVYIASVFVISSLLGPVLGGLATEHLHWSVIFWINLPLGFLAYLSTSHALRKLPRREKKHALDIPGAMLMTSATLVLLLALSWGGIRFPWSGPEILGLLALSAILCGLLVHRLRTAPEPLIPADLLRNPVVRWGILAGCCGMGTFIGLTIYVPLYLETVHRLSATDSGLALMPLMLGTVVGATLSARIMTHVAHYRRLPAVSLLGAMTGTAVLAWNPHGLSLPTVQALLGILGIGVGMLFPVTTVAVQNAVTPHQLGTATGMANFFRQLGGALVVAVFGAIVLNAFAGTGRDVGFEALVELAGRGGSADVFSGVFAAASLGLFFAWAFILRMPELPLAGRAKHAAESVIAD